MAKGDNAAVADTGLTQDPLSMKKLKAQFGISSAILDENPELKEALQKVLDLQKQGKTPTDENIVSMLNETNWFKNHSAQWMQVEIDRQKKAPAIWDAQVKNIADQIKEQFLAAGADIDDATATKYAEQTIYGSGMNADGVQEIYDNNWLNKTIASAIDFTKTKTVAGIEMYDLSGAAETTAKDLYELANNYGIDSSMTNTAFTSWFEKSFKGLINKTVASEDIDDELINMAVSKYPGLAKQLSRGVTLRAAANPYLKTLADELELDPETFDLNDNLAQRVLNSVDEQGNFKPMSLYDAKLAARKDERWKFTGQARQEYTDIGNTILRDFGFLG